MNNQKTPQQRGKAGEEHAAEHIVRMGGTVLSRNYHSRAGEIDIIARMGDCVVFAEVKLRKQGSAVSGEEAVNKAKMRKIYKTALLWLAENPCDLQPRFDVITVTPQNGEYNIKHIENAFGEEVMC